MSYIKRLAEIWRRQGCAPVSPLTQGKYSQLSLSRLRLSRITTYLEEKIWSFLKHRNLKSGYKILWKRGEIAPSPLFHNIFNIHFYLKESSYIVICKNWLFKLFFPQYYKSDMSKYDYLELFLRVPSISR